ncbi:MAG: hypothetical protein LBQ73_11370 [Tannerellaceae bacterium]|nr:hypothetical protein [Tannerellaceae bacterium]
MRWFFSHSSKTCRSFTLRK